MSLAYEKLLSRSNNFTKFSNASLLHSLEMLKSNPKVMFSHKLRATGCIRISSTILSTGMEVVTSALLPMMCLRKESSALSAIPLIFSFGDHKPPRESDCMYLSCSASSNFTNFNNPCSSKLRGEFQWGEFLFFCTVTGAHNHQYMKVAPALQNLF